MKKLLVGLLVVGLIAVTGYVGYKYFTEEKRLAVDEIVPGDAIVFLQLSDIQKNMTRIQETPLWQEWSGIDYERLMREMNSQQKDIDQFMAMKKNFEEITSNDILKRFLNKEAAVVVYPIDLNVEQMMGASKATFVAMMTEFYSGIHFVTRVSADIQVVEFLSRFNPTFNSEVATREIVYKGYTMHLVTFKDTGLSIGYVRHGDLLVLGLGPKAAQRTIDVLNNDTASLAGHPLYSESKQNFYASAGANLYLNLEKMFNIFKDEMAAITKFNEAQLLKNPVDDETLRNQNEQFKAGVDSFYDSVKGFKAAGLSHVFDDLWRLKVNVDFDLNDLSSKMKPYYQNCSPVDNKSISFTPKDVFGYQWGSCFDLSLYWKEIQDNINQLPNQAGNVQTQIQNLERTWGLSVENDILPAFGREVGGFITDVSDQGLFPIPQISFFIKIKNRDKMNMLLGKLLDDKPMIMLQEASHEDIDYRYVFLPLGEVFQPSYAYLGDFFVLSINQQSLKEAIDAQKSKSARLTSDANFSKVDVGLTKPSNGVFYVELSRAASTIKSLIEWANTWTGSQEEQKQAFQAGSQNKLSDTQDQIKELRTAILDLEDAVWQKESVPEKSELIKSELKSLNTELTMKENALAQLQEQEKDLLKIASKHKESTLNASQRRTFIDGFINPVLDGLESIKAIGSKTRIERNMLEINLYSDMGI